MKCELDKCNARITYFKVRNDYWVATSRESNVLQHVSSLTFFLWFQALMTSSGLPRWLDIATMVQSCSVFHCHRTHVVDSQFSLSLNPYTPLFTLFTVSWPFLSLFSGPVIPWPTSYQYPKKPAGRFHEDWLAGKGWKKAWEQIRVVQLIVKEWQRIVHRHLVRNHNT
jgi:hypothetical protein